MRRQGAEAIGVMERGLEGPAFLTGAAPTVADIALYAYTPLAGEAGISLKPFSAVRAWLARCAALPGHIGMDQAS
ncbi:MAG: glutathione binding-like protein [Planctomycetota bacterium]|nr:glutathione binding-like protein [Planctomycetota bacterium]